MEVKKCVTFIITIFEGTGIFVKALQSLLEVVPINFLSLENSCNVDSALTAMGKKKFQREKKCRADLWLILILTARTMRSHPSHSCLVSLTE